MISDLELVQACADTYVQPPTLPVPYTGTDVRITKAADGAWVIAFRGSVTAEDWMRDFVFTPIVARAHPQLGPCHAGFLDGAESVLPAIDAVIGRDPFYVTGHSLGGALALGLAGLLTAAGRVPKRFATFGAPRFGMAPFVSLMSAVPGAQYRRGNDIVPLVPFDVPPDFEFRDTRMPLISVGVAQTDFLECHNIAGYVQDVGVYLSKRAATAA
jgi:hypothetical protein